jgi:hypothetical protein
LKGYRHGQENQTEADEAASWVLSVDENSRYVIWAENHEDKPVYAKTWLGSEFQAFRLGILSWLRLSPQRVCVFTPHRSAAMVSKPKPKPMKPRPGGY